MRTMQFYFAFDTTTHKHDLNPRRVSSELSYEGLFSQHDNLRITAKNDQAIVESLEVSTAPTAIQEQTSPLLKSRAAPSTYSTFYLTNNCTDLGKMITGSEKGRRKSTTRISNHYSMKTAATKRLVMVQTHHTNSFPQRFQHSQLFG